VQPQTWRLAQVIVSMLMGIFLGGGGQYVRSGSAFSQVSMSCERQRI